MTKLKEHSREICYTFTPLFSFFILLINMVFLHPKGHFDGLSTIHRTGETQLCVGDNIAVHANIGPPLHLLHQYDYLFLLADHQHHLHHCHHHCTSGAGIRDARAGYHVAAEFQGIEVTIPIRKKNKQIDKPYRSEQVLRPKSAALTSTLR